MERESPGPDRSGSAHSQANIRTVDEIKILNSNAFWKKRISSNNPVRISGDEAKKLNNMYYYSILFKGLPKSWFACFLNNWNTLSESCIYLVKNTLFSINQCYLMLQKSF